eukprot:218522-Chlamydomonas_euryale.AAC.2
MKPPRATAERTHIPPPSQTCCPAAHKTPHPMLQHCSLICKTCLQNSTGHRNMRTCTLSRESPHQGTDII